MPPESILTRCVEEYRHNAAKRLSIFSDSARVALYLWLLSGRPLFVLHRALLAGVTVLLKFGKLVCDAA